MRMTFGSRKAAEEHAEVAGAATSSPDLRDIRAFCALVDLGSMTATGRHFGETKGSISRRIARLEAALGVSLLKRYPRRVEPTEAGLLYRAQIGKALEAVDAAGAAVRQAKREPKGVLRVTAPSDLGVALIAPLLSKFLDAYPDIRVDLLLTEKILAFDAHQLDIAVRVGERLADSSLVAHRLCMLEGQMFAAPTYLRKHGTPKSLSDLKSHRIFKLHSSSSGNRAPRLVDRSWRTTAEQPEFQIAATVDAAVGRELALAGGGIALLPTVVARPEVQAGRLVAVLPSVYMEETAQLFVLHPHATRLPAGTRAFQEFLRTALASARPSS